MAGIKISNLLQIEETESGDFLPIARGGSETYKTPATQFVTRGQNIGSGTGQFFINQTLVSGKQTMRFRTLSAVGDGISLTTVGNTVVLNLTGTTPTVTKHIANGTQINFPVSIPAPISTNPANYRIDIDGVIQEPLTDYTIQGSNIRFTEAPPLSSKVVIVSNGIIRSFDVIPTLNSITSGMLVDGSVITSKIALSSIGTEQLSAQAVTSEKLANTLNLSNKTVTLSAGSITTQTIANNAVNNTKLSLTANASEIKKALNADNTPPIYACRAWVNFRATEIFDIPCTYTRSGGGNIKVTLTGLGAQHNLLPNSIVYINFTSGTATDNFFKVTSVDSPSEFNVPQLGNFTSGNANIRICFIRGSGNVSSIAYLGQGEYALNFSTPMPDATYAVTFGGRARAGYVLSTEDGVDGQFQQTTNAFFFNITNTTPTNTNFSQVHCAVFR
jgi:hypothetical protein